MASQSKMIKGYSHYSVTSEGKVISLNAGKYMNLWESKRRNGDTDLRVSLYKNGKKKNFRVHRLVAKAFLPNPHRYPEVDHKNGNTHDNRIQNLEWVTRTENERRKNARIKKKVLAIHRKMTS